MAWRHWRPAGALVACARNTQIRRYATAAPKVFKFPQAFRELEEKTVKPLKEIKWCSEAFPQADGPSIFEPYVRTVPIAIRELEEHIAKKEKIDARWISEALLIGATDAQINTILELARPLEGAITPFSLNAAIYSYGKNKSPAKAEELFGKFAEYGVTPDRKTYAMLMSAYCQVDNADKAFETFEKGKAVGHKMDSWTYETLMNFSFDYGLMTKGLALVEEMDKLKVKPTLHMLNSLIRGWRKIGQPLKARKVFDRIKKEGYEHNMDSWNELLSSYAYAGHGNIAHIQGMFDCVRDMIDAGFRPDARSYFLVVKSLILLKHWNTARIWYERGLREGNLADSKIVEIISSYTFKKGDYKFGSELLSWGENNGGVDTSKMPKMTDPFYATWRGVE